MANFLVFIKEFIIFIALTFILLMPVCQFSLANQHFFSLKQLKEEAAQFLQEHYQDLPHKRIDISVGNLDSRLKLNPCSLPLEMTIQDPEHQGGNISMQIKCVAQPTWSVHVAAQVLIYQQVPVAKRELTRGEQISADDITNKIINISEIHQSFTTTIEDIIGKQVKRNLAAGEVFKGQSLESLKVIKRGDLVVLEMLTGQIRVSSSATAMSDGRIGEKIKVKNAQSQRIVMGEVMGEGLVRTQ
jgi:flagellar basal body P-ring formation protein FlgA